MSSIRNYLCDEPVVGRLEKARWGYYIWVEWGVMKIGVDSGGKSGMVVTPYWRLTKAGAVKKSFKLVETVKRWREKLRAEQV